MSDRNDGHQRYPANVSTVNIYKFQLTISPSSSLAWSRFRWAITRSFDGNSRLQPVDTPLASSLTLVPIVQLTIKCANKDFRPKRAQEKFNPTRVFCAYSSGLVTLAIPGLSCWGVVASASRSERVTSTRNRLTDRPARPVLP